MNPMATPEQTQTQVCYRHPRNETAVSCSNCGRPICTDCMVFSAVGIKCPECAGQPTGTKRAATRVRAAASEGTGFSVTNALIVANIAAYLVQASGGGTFTNPAGEIFQKGYLRAFEVGAGEWWRLITYGFLHGSPIHLLFNMLMLWWFGRALEAAVGRARFLGIYLVSAIAGAAGALLLSGEFVITVGASGAVFGILGAGLVLERRHIYVFGGGALFVVILNVAFTFAVSSISIGGHLGGLIGGILSMLALSAAGRHPIYGRFDLASFLALVAIAAGSVLIAYFRVRGYG